MGMGILVFIVFMAGLYWIISKGLTEVFLLASWVILIIAGLLHALLSLAH